MKSILSIPGNNDIHGVYSEMSTMPIMLTDPDHLPRSPFLDFNFFQTARSRHWPVAAYYRDLHWRFPEYAHGKSRWKEMVKVPFHHLEIWQLYNSVDHVFLPSSEMAPYMPGKFDAHRFSALPPGNRTLGGRRKQLSRTEHQDLNLLYIGGVTPPLYNLGMMLRAVDGSSNTTLTLCCREHEWQNSRCEYQPLSNVHIVHRHGEALSELYEKADVFLMAFEQTEYMKFAMPVKLFEAIGWELPIIALSGSAAGNFVETEKCGWTVSTVTELKALLSSLRQNPKAVQNAQLQTKAVSERHSWQARAREVISKLEEYRKRGTT